ncbi:MAG: redoxin domain-containing protein [Planctomycetales bacterium]|nr:redoxin domain-containing protein [Planctomycetales bacterium]
MPRLITFASVLSLFCVVGCNQSAPPAAPRVAATPATPAIKAPANSPPEQSDEPAVTTTETPKADGEKPETTPEPPKTAEDFVTLGTQLLRKRDNLGAIKAFEEALKLSPDDRQTNLMLASATQSRGLELAQQKKQVESAEWFLKSAATLRQMREKFAPLDEREEGFLMFALYNEACAHGVTGNAEKALAVLNEVVDLGWSELEQLDEDEDLKSVRELPNFGEFRESVVTRLKERAVKHARQLLAEQEPFPFTFSLPNLDGKAVSLAEFAGKVVIVDIWGTWCPPCKKEIPHFVKLHETYHAKGFDIVGLNYERVKPEDAPAKIRSFVEEQHMPYQCLIGDEETQKQVPDFQGFPTTLFIDRTGRVRLSVVGYHSYHDLEAIVVTLLDEPAAEKTTEEKSAEKTK